MKQGISNISFVVKEPKNYLVAELEEGVDLQDYCITVAERNSIPGLLTVSRQFDNGADVLYFDVTGKKRVSSVLNPEQKDVAVFLTLNYIVEALKGLPDYFLHSSQCLLDADYVFVDSHFQVGFALVPMKSDPEDGSAQIREFFMNLLALCTSGQNQNRYAHLMAYLIHPEFRLDEFAQLIAGSVGRAPSAAIVREKPVNRPAAPAAMGKPAPAAKEKIGVAASAEPVKGGVLPARADSGDPKPGKGKEEKGTNGGFAIPGVAIPGGGKVPPIPEPKKKAQKEPKEPKQQKKPFFSLGKKKVEEEVRMNEEVHVVSGGTPAPQAFPQAHQAPQNQTPWNATVSFENFGGGQTEFIDTGVDGGSALIYQGRTVPMAQLPFTIGRLDCSFLINSPKISKRHITIWQEGNEFYVRDENSLNHTYLNGLMLQPFAATVLPDGAELRLGNEKLTVRLGTNR